MLFNCIVTMPGRGRPKGVKNKGKRKDANMTDAQKEEANRKRQRTNAEKKRRERLAAAGGAGAANAMRGFLQPNLDAQLEITEEGTDDEIVIAEDEQEEEIQAKQVLQQDLPSFSFLHLYVVSCD